MRIPWRKGAPLVWMLVFPVLGAMYAWINNVEGREVYSLMTAVDQAIPFVKYFAFPYSIWIFYIYACLIYFFKKDVNVYYRAVVTYTVCTLACYFIYSVFQTTVPRPVLVGDDPATQLMAFLYNRDQPFNCFPSIHCFSSYLMMRLLISSGFRNKLNQSLIYSMSTLIILSTLFVKQHVILDAVGGVVLVEIAVAGIAAVERSLRESRARGRQQNRSLGA